VLNVKLQGLKLENNRKIFILLQQSMIELDLAANIITNFVGTEVTSDNCEYLWFIFFM
jgi:hypothetical protein